MTRLQNLINQLARIEQKLDSLEKKQTIRSFYSTAEFAAIVGLSEFYVRDLCRLGGITAAKKSSGRGKYKAWTIPHEELLRFQEKGALRPRKSKLD